LIGQRYVTLAHESRVYPSCVPRQLPVSVARRCVRMSAGYGCQRRIHAETEQGQHCECRACTSTPNGTRLVAARTLLQTKCDVQHLKRAATSQQGGGAAYVAGNSSGRAKVTGSGTAQSASPLPATKFANFLLAAPHRQQGSGRHPYRPPSTLCAISPSDGSLPQVVARITYRRKATQGRS
jgi:hypothetical protein